MNIRIIQWNIKFNCSIEKIIDLLKLYITDNCIINLQEVSQNSILQLKESNSLDYAYSLDLRTPGIYESKNRKMGVATFVAGGIILKKGLLNNTVFPERTLLTGIKFEEATITNLTFHSLTGVDYKKAKSSNFASIASFLYLHSIDLFTCDANEPKVDSYDEQLIECFDNRDKGKNASLLFGKNKVHDFVDSYKAYAKSVNLSIDSGFTHITGKKPKRYDFIYGNKNWKILSSTSYYKEAVNATSDHAILITDYSI
jgi:hypothetical protein